MNYFYLCSFLLADALFEEPEDLFERFQEWKRTHTKTYHNETHEAYHWGRWQENWQLVEGRNRNESHPLTLKMNHFADMGREEWKQWLLNENGGSVFAKAKDLSDIVPKGIPLYTHNPDYNPPKRKFERRRASGVDWRSQGAVTDVKNQGGCGSCWAFSAVGACEGAYAIKNGNLMEFSEQQLLDCSSSYGNMGCSGGLMDYAFEYLKNTALCSSSAYSYQGSQGSCKDSICSYSNHMASIKGYSKVSSYYDSTLASALDNGPVSVAIDASSYDFQLYSSGVFSSSFCSTSLDHGVLAVGYGTASSGTGYWIVKNSWSSNWGNGGYVLMERKQSNSQQYGCCGILSLSSYPVLS